uniref:Uncharacterized protein n=1 Tax=viral metagenome TaxID=1070528 RepID=A0A6C0J9A8_9ZZZZ
MNITINNRNTLQRNFPIKKECPEGKFLYRVTFGYTSKLSGDAVFPVTYDNFNQSFQTKSLKLNAGDMVKYTPQNKSDPNYNTNAIITVSTNRYENREAQSRGFKIRPDRDKYSLFDIEFINPVVGSNNTVIKDKKELSRLNKDKSVQLTKIQTEVDSYVCEDSFLPYRQVVLPYKRAVEAGSLDAGGYFKHVENRMWNDNFELDGNNQPMYPLMDNFTPPLKRKLEKAVENMVTVGFLLGKEQKPKVEVKSKNAKFISFLMPIGSKPGETITVPISGIKVVVKIPISLGEIGGDDSEIPRENEYIKKVPIIRELNSEVYDSLKTMSSKSVDTEFIPTYIKASEYIGPDSQKNLDMLIKPGISQQYFISKAKIIPQNGNKFIFKKLTSFDKSFPLIFDIYVLLDLTLNLKLKGPEEATDDTFGGKLTRTITAGLMNGSNNCPEYMEKAKKGVKELLSSVVPQGSLTKYESGPRGVVDKMLRGREAGALEVRDNHAEVVRKRRERNLKFHSNAMSRRGRGVRQRRGGRRKNKTRRKKIRTCVKNVTKRLNKCWGKKKRKTFKKCWKKGRNKYKSCKKRAKKTRRKHKKN